MSHATQLDPDLWLLDLNFQGAPNVIAAFLVTSPDGHTLIETGPGSTLPALERGISAAGARLEDVAQLAVTHIHLDHAGAAGTLLRRLPRARLFVHPAGAPHMIDPSKLLASATRIYGDAMDRLWGAFEPCPADRVLILADDAELRAGTRTLRALHTPGHASHHIAFVDMERKTAFTGDVAGVRLGASPYVRPPTPPPDIDIPAWHDSAHRLRALGLRALDLTHFGRIPGAAAHLDTLVRNLDDWLAWITDRLRRGEDPATVAEELMRKGELDVIRAGGSAADAAAYELATPSRMSVDGISRYMRKSRG
ncbi:MAG TPA: MBL fold metallo-hydrolase [Gemmatimonadaceae bacterium]|nr:MBL fold metallo-hydrolase [Gemmatimonadaceae bacterium]